MSLKKRLNQVERGLAIRFPTTQMTVYHMCCNPTEEERKIVRDKITELGLNEVNTISYAPWESRHILPLPRLGLIDPSDRFEWEWDYELGIGFNSEHICKFVGEYPKGKAFENDSQLYKVNKVDKTA
ncbi:hypothetical protein ACFLXP_00525 [Chloroflexota bacterium]